MHLNLNLARSAAAVICIEVVARNYQRATNSPIRYARRGENKTPPLQRFLDLINLRPGTTPIKHIDNYNNTH